MTNWDEIDVFAKEWIKAAGSLIKESFSKELVITTKSNKNDLVTEIDRNTEKFFIDKIRETYPDHKILGEEGLGDTISSLEGIVWIIDPIDGTMNFVHMQRNFAISIGIFENGIGKVGLVYDVVHDELYHAKKGQGAFLNELELEPLQTATVSEGILGLNPTWIIENKRIDHNMLVPLVKDVRGTRNYGSAALEIAYVAAGRLDAYISPRLSPWDYGGGKVLVEELGGIATDLKGKPLDLLSTTTVFISKPGLHGEVMSQYLQNGNWS
ncbi:inositol monophosphatase family protein [Niallia sp. XMNu-256]|uniref:inositol monophosphatase family protein n=1 Tax=Niallia sp. XMNu-256 TaxID=3082444 RepID=UPI0030CC4671